MDENWNLLVNWVHLQKQLALVIQILFPELILYLLLCQCNPCSHAIHTKPLIQQNQLLRHFQSQQINSTSSTAYDDFKVVQRVVRLFERQQISFIIFLNGSIIVTITCQSKFLTLKNLSLVEIVSLLLFQVFLISNI